MSDEVVVGNGSGDELVDQYVPGFVRAFSAERLESYRKPSIIGNLEMLTNYFWNIELCESLMPSFHAVEVVLRNSIHDAFSRRFETSEWFDAPDVLDPNQLNQVANARKQLQVSLKESRRAEALRPGQIVAELSFGFWVALLSDRYQRRVWQPNDFATFWAVFPDGRGPTCRRHLVHNRLDRLRRLRNRVSHHEPIWYRTDLAELHADAHELIGWINPTLYRAIRAVDDFATVRRGKDAVRDRLLESLIGP